MRLLAIAALLLVTGCAGGYADKTFRQVHLPSFDAVRNWPVPGQETTVQIGETMISAFLAPVMPAVSVGPYRQIAQYRRDLRMAIDVPAGTLQLAGTDDTEGRYFGATDGIRLAYEAKGSFNANAERLPGGIHVDRAGGKSVYWFWPGAASASMVPAPDVVINNTTVERPAREARFQKQLVYSGTSQSTVSVLYREFENATARPAFSQELKYDLAKDRVIGYQRARFEIIEAGNTSIRYRVLAPLEIESKP